MCKQKNRLTLQNGKTVRIDACISDLVLHLNSEVTHTVASCCGHGKYPVTILCCESPHSPVFDYCSGEQLERRYRFYKRDKEGIYFVPEMKELRKKHKVVRP